MLLQLSIHHLALIEEITIEFAPGFNVLTGETGAGKSIVVDAVNLVLGERADREMIALGAAKAAVEALFDTVGNAALSAMLAELQIPEEEGLLSISRELTQAGRNLCRVNGVVVPLVTLRRISAQLLDIHGQHEHQLLLDAENHIDYLDNYAADEIMACREQVSSAYAAWHEQASRLTKLRHSVAEREQRMDMLRFQLDELRSARLSAGEETELEAKKRFYRNAERILSSLDEACTLLQGGAGDEPAACTLLRDGVNALSVAAGVGEPYDKLYERLDGLCYEVEDAADELARVRESLDFNEEDAEAVESRLDLLRRLGRKYGATSADMLAYQQKITLELEALEGSEEQSERLEKDVARLRSSLEKACSELSRLRRAAAERFETDMQRQLRELGMKNAQMKAQFAEQEEVRFTPRGVDQVEFLFTANLGQPLRPLTKVASGGELSRIMLALKDLSAKKPGVPRSMVFDEIDTGISGRMAQVVAEKMSDIGDHHQVICVTHLPQIAAMADEQYLVQKTESEGVTRTEVRRMDEAGRIEELARMIGGAGEGASSAAHARQMLLEAEERKRMLRAHIKK